MEIAVYTDRHWQQLRLQIAEMTLNVVYVLWRAYNK